MPPGQTGSAHTTSDRLLAAASLAGARARVGMTQRELAKRAGVPASVVNAIERAKRQPSVPTLANLVRAAGCELRLDLTGREDEERPGGILAELLIHRGRCAVTSRPDDARARKIYDALDTADRMRRAKVIEHARVR